MSEYSVLGDDGNNANKLIDANFTLDFGKLNAFKK
jgi:hypothetical protein